MILRGSFDSSWHSLDSIIASLLSLHFDIVALGSFLSLWFRFSFFLSLDHLFPFFSFTVLAFKGYFFRILHVLRFDDATGLCCVDLISLCGGQLGPFIGYVSGHLFYALVKGAFNRTELLLTVMDEL